MRMSTQCWVVAVVVVIVVGIRQTRYIFCLFPMLCCVFYSKVSIVDLGELLLYYIIMTILLLYYTIVSYRAVYRV